MRVGYVVKRFPRVSETFVAQEVLELERRGVEVQVLALGQVDVPATHAWLSELRAPVRIIDEPFADAWTDLSRRRAHPASRRGVLRVLDAALDCPPDWGRRCLTQATAVARIAESGEFDHLHAHFADRPATVAMLAGLLCDVPFSVTAHAKDIWLNPAGPSHWRRLMREAAFVVAVSEATRTHLADLAGTMHSYKVRRLLNGVDLSRLRPPAMARAAAGEPELLCVARLVEKKGIDVLLDACALLARAGHSFRLSVVGDGPQAESLRAQAAAQGLAGRVEFHGAAVHEDVIRRMRQAAVFVLPCRIASDGDRDTLPTVLIEAMACGLPCVSTPVGGVAEIIEDGRTGALVPAQDPAALARALADLLRSPRLREAMGRRGRERAERHFDCASNVAMLHGWFRAAAAPPQPRRQPVGATA